MEIVKRECKLCDNIITNGNFRVIGDDMRNIFDLLLLRLTLDDDTQNVMCTACSTKLLSALNFKSTCLYMDNSIVPYINFESRKPVDLKEIYAKEKGCKPGGSELDDGEVCRLCLQSTSSDHKSIQEVSIDSIRMYIPEINFAVTTNPVICMKCQDALCDHSSFIKNCSDVEKKRSMVAMDVEDILLANPSIKTEEIEIKLEPEDEEMLFHIPYNIKKEEKHEEGDTSLHSQNTEAIESLYDPEDIKPTSADCTSLNCESQSESAEENKLKTRQTQQQHPSAQILTCDECDYRSTQKRNIRRHRLGHKNPTELRFFKCDDCHYKSTKKDRFTRHRLLHTDPSQVQVYKCDECDYESIEKSYLRRHQLRHKDPSEVRMYKCDVCDYRSIEKSGLRKHQLVHKAPSEVYMYVCDKCDYKSARKDNFKQHQVIHKTPSEVLMYKCDECEFETRHKGYLAKHRVTHKHPSEVQKYKCDDCEYEAIRKCELRKHELRHRDPSEVQKYTCDECDYKSCRSTDLKTHQLRHKDPSEVRMYKCKDCEYTNKYRSNIAQHRLKHMDASQVKMWKCDVCEFETKYKRYLKKHRLLHRDPPEAINVTAKAE